MSGDQTPAGQAVTVFATDPTTEAIERMNVERVKLLAEVDRLNKIGDAMFVAGYDHAVREIRDHFAKMRVEQLSRHTEVVAEIEKIWIKGKTP